MYVVLDHGVVQRVHAQLHEKLEELVDRNAAVVVFLNLS